MPEETTAQTTTDESVNNTGANASTTATEAETQAQPKEKTFTQADVDRIVQNRLKTAVKAELKKLAGDGDAPNVDELQKQLADAQKSNRVFEAKESIRDYLNDPKNKLSVKSQDMAGAVALISQNLEFDDSGSVSNLKDAIAQAQALAPTLFAQSVTHINQANGGKPPAANDMNAWIRQQHAAKN